MMEKIRIKIDTSNKSKTLLKLNNLNINMHNIMYQKEAIIFDTTKEDYKKIKKYLVSIKPVIVSVYGKDKIKKNIKTHSLFLVSLIFGIVIFLFLSNIIVEVRVIHDDKKLRDNLEYALKMRGVSAMSFKKSYQEYENIIEDIKNEFKMEIEWLEIDVKGMVINVRVEERIIKNFDKEYQTCHVVAGKSGIIINAETEKGVSLVRQNSFVKSGDILISGEISLNEEVKENVCASGRVYAEVWYQVSTTLPMEYEETLKTGKMRYNFMINVNGKDTVLLKSRVEEKAVINKKLFSFFGITFYIQKEYEVKREKKTYTEDEAMSKAQNLIHEKLSLNSNQFEEIINEKVLQKSVNNGNLYIDMFVAVKEQIGVRKYYTVEMDSGTNDEGNNASFRRIN